jgi:hypothetical protein
MSLVRPFFNKFKDKVDPSLKENHDFGQNAIGSGELVGFLKRHQTKFAIFYCFDVPIGSLQFYRDDPGVKLILKYHIAIKLAVFSHMLIHQSKI